MTDITLIPVQEFTRLFHAPLAKYEKLALIADMCRANTLAVVKRAGSGHLGSSFSAMDIVVWLYYEWMNTRNVGWQSPARDIYFSSKGHDVPGLYSVLFSLGVIPQDKFLKLRRFGGLDGHPDVSVPGIEANSGSLGMGISKGRGMAWAKRAQGFGGRVFVLTGDGELQEGQNYEALQSAVQQRVTNLNVIVDHNKLQSDKPVSEIVDLGNLEEKFRSFGWYVARADGHDLHQLEAVLTEFDSVNDCPKILIADTIKGRGISFMEHPQALRDGQGLYRWHAGAPPDDAFRAGYDELIMSINARLRHLGMNQIVLQVIAPEQESASLRVSLVGEPSSIREELSEELVVELSSIRAPAKRASSVSNEYVAQAYGEALVELAGERPDLVVLDGDLAADCRVRVFELSYPKRFIENGIAEQDMVSMAGGLARQGLLPVVNSFASFLASRANEQIYNNASEKTKVIYACHYAGLIPAGPGKSHQSIRDISLLGALPNMLILQPCNAKEARLVVRYCVNEARENCALRLNIGPSPRLIELPEDYSFAYGRGVTLLDGTDAVLLGYGPVMLHEALLAADTLRELNFSLHVVNMPWLNRVDKVWLGETLRDHTMIYVLDDHAPVGGLGDLVLDTMMQMGELNGRHVTKFAVEGYPACGTPSEALEFHRLDGASLAERILRQQDAVR